MEEELRKARGSQSASVETSPATVDPDLPLEAATDDESVDDSRRTSTKSARSESIIERLCGAKWQLNSDEGGQLHFYGPTSSLHLTESVSSSILQWGLSTTGGDLQNQLDVAPELQNYLLDLYWNHQHTVLQVVHKESFLNDMATGRTRYYSKLLLYCIFACAARISDRPDIRALALPLEDDVEDEQPYFVKRATELLEFELKRPQITTIQSLQLLSVMDCSRSNDTKGWLYSGISVYLFGGERMLMCQGAHAG